MATRKFTKRPVLASAGRVIKASQSFWSTDVSSEDEIKQEIHKAINVGTTLDDVDDYLNELYNLQIIDDEQFSELINWAATIIGE